MYGVFWDIDNEFHGQIFQFDKYCSYYQFEPDIYAAFRIFFAGWKCNLYGHNLHFSDICSGDSCNFRNALEWRNKIVIIQPETIPSFLPPRLNGSDERVYAHDAKT